MTRRLQELLSTPIEELEDLYDIEVIDETDEVYDTIDNKYYTNLAAWAQALLESENETASMIKMHRHSKYEDDY